MTITKLAQEFAEENGISEEANQAYIDYVGEKYATADDVAEAYQGEYENDIEFAEELASELGYIDSEFANQWPGNCIDWEKAARELMYDYFEQDGYYFRNM